jgi:hypothetical protein
VIQNFRPKYLWKYDTPLLALSLKNAILNTISNINPGSFTESDIKWKSKETKVVYFHLAQELWTTSKSQDAGLCGRE